MAVLKYSKKIMQPRPQETTFTVLAQELIFWKQLAIFQMKIISALFGEK